MTTATAVEPTKPLCARCRSNPVLAALSICKPCLKRQVDTERRERERRRREWTKEQRRQRRVAPARATRVGAVTATIVPLSAAARAYKPPFCTLGFGRISRKDIATLPADVAPLIPIPEHYLRRKSASAQTVSQTLRQLRLTGLKCRLRSFDLLPQLRRLFVLRQLVANTFEEVEGRLACGEIIGPLLDGHDALP